MIPRRTLLLGAALAAIAAGSARACPDHSTRTAVNAASRQASASALLAWKPRAWAPPVAQGFQVAIDPVDGAYSMPAVDETPALRVPVEEQPVSVTRRNDGSVRLELDERFADFAVVTMGADGKPRWTCVHSSGQANKFMKAPSLPAPPAGTVWEEK